MFKLTLILTWETRVQVFLKMYLFIIIILRTTSVRTLLSLLYKVNVAIIEGLLLPCERK